MFISKCGFRYRHSPTFQITRPHGSSNYLLLILRSPAFFVLAGEKRLVNPHSVIIFQKDTPQLYGAHEEAFVNDWVHFDMDEADLRWFQALRLPLDTVIELFSAARLSEIMQNLCREKRALTPHGEASSNLYLRLLLMKLADLVHTPAQTNPALYHRLLKLKEDIYARPQQEWCAEATARQLSLSLSHLQHSYKNCFGVSFKQDVLAARIQYAQHLLFTTNDTISAIAQACGFASDVHFMRLFKKHVSLTPTDYRKFGG